MDATTSPMPAVAGPYPHATARPRTRGTPRDLRRLWRATLAAVLPLGPLTVAVAFALRPFRLSDDPIVIVENILASPWTDLLLWLGFVAPGLLLVATVIAGHLARRGAGRSRAGPSRGCGRAPTRRAPSPSPASSPSPR